MPDSKREKILQSFEGTLATITTAGGYNYDIGTKQVTREIKSISEMEADQFPRFEIQEIKEIIDRHGAIGIKHLMVTLRGFVRWSGDDKGPSVMLNKLLKDCLDILMLDPTRGQEGAYCDYTDIRLDPVTYEPFGIFEVDFDCMYSKTDNAL